MKEINAALEELKNINTSYGIDIDGISRLQAEMSAAKVCTPIIGKFSSGKSALVNTLLGYSKRILREDITPETAIPAEIVYTDSEDSITVIKNDGTYKQLNVDEYRTYEADANTVKSARIELRNSFLEKIPDVMIVDMPGFESGFEVHNKAIDNYLPQSLSYIIAIPADDMIVRSSVGNILKELCLHDMPLCVVITKYDKRNDDFEVTFQKMKESLKRFVGDREITYCKTSSFTGEAEELEEFLIKIQDESQDILALKYKKQAFSLVENTRNYLITTLKGSNLSESELDEKEEKLQRQKSSLEGKFSKEKEDFDAEVEDCIEEIKSDVQSALKAEESTFVAMILNNQKINEQLNSVVRNAVTVSIKKRFIPRVEKYLKRIEKVFKSESVGDINFSFVFDTYKISKGMTSSIVAGVATALVSGLGFLGLLTGFLVKKITDKINDKRREKAKQEISEKLNTEVFPQVLREVGENIEMEITKQVKLVNTSIEEDFTNQRETLEKAMADLRQQMKDEKTKKENLAVDINEDLERIERIENGLR